MRRYLVFALLSLMVFSLAMSLVTRPRAAHKLPAVRKGTSASKDRRSAGKRQGSGAIADKAGASKASPSPAKAAKLARTLRLVCLRWAPCAPAIAANGGSRTTKDSEYKKRGLDLRIGARANMHGIEQALGAGGSKDGGAHVAVVPLPELVAAHERLRALAPQVFLLTGWSQGDLALIARSPAAARSALRARGHARVTLSGEPGRPATLLALFALDLSGVSLDRVALVDTGSRSAKLYARAGLHVRGLAHQRTLLTSADAQRLVPYVAVAPRGLINARADALVRLADGWFAGAKRAAADVPAAARALAGVARQEHDSARRSASALIADLGHIAPASLLDNARSFGLSGRPPLTVDWLYRKSHQLWRRSGQLAAQTPRRAPVHAEVLARLIRERPVADLPVVAARDADTRSEQPGLRFDASSRSRALLVHHSRTRSTRALADRLAIIAAIFDGSRVELRHARGRRAAQRVLERATKRFDIDNAARRLSAGPRSNHAAALISVSPLQTR